MHDPTPELPDETLISQVDFPTRILNALAAAGLRTVGKVREASDEMLLSLARFGAWFSFIPERHAGPAVPRWR